MKRIFAALLLLILSGAAINAQQWKEFSSAKGKFSVMFPGEPEESVRPVDTYLGKVDMHLFLLERKNSAYFVIYFEFPEEILKNDRIDSMLLSVRKTLLNKFEGAEILTETAVTRDSFPGRQFTFSFQDGQMKGKHQSFIAGRRGYQIMMMTPSEEFYNSENDQFFDSFKFHKGAEKSLIDDLLTELEIEYDTAEGGGYKLELKTDSLRTQGVNVTPSLSAVYNRQVYLVWSFVHRTNGKLGEAEANSLLAANSEMEACSFQVVENKESDYKTVILTAWITNDPDAKELMNVMSEIAIMADAKEKELNGQDEF